MKIRKAVFPVAGFGTRMLPATKAIPKEMITLVDKPLIQYAVEEAVEAGIEEIIFITGRFKRAIEDHFDKSIELEIALKESKKEKEYEILSKISEMCDFITVRQKEQKGLGHAIYCARDVLGKDPFVVILPDDIISYKESVTGQLIKKFEEFGSPVLAITEVPAEETYKYGIVDIEKKMDERTFKLKGMVEKPKSNPPSNYAIIGRYVLTYDVLKAIEECDTNQGEIQLTDAIRKVTKDQSSYGYLYDGLRFDCGNKIGYLDATIHFALNRDDLKDDFTKILKKYC
ncbi:UTP--glucose-1-phosphate uridylyltransferase GalU [Calditerrivibrio nitroreducens]|uniref:UTP--glucose-1-phosphate uridylyltransferase n=1 Tax=Calditerrivibrio nitroreducens (strain DSM 19672 / NBRC 101217 / Yu37-1) TaxID=768670 RepID=E4TFG9_CALNY|nr:UTP--glucose-1-phosphate uridylyltransferase GalU [Calditerrivibrio nitroreducens]ADR19542.1 UDP-glucose pyrophosphorylase [Calditerrivibrio nitroreducens DSM 19672]